MKHKLFHLLYILLFLGICLTPFLGMAILGPSEAAANEILAVPPKLTLRDGSFNMSVADDTEEYIADRFAFRQELVTAWAALNAKLLHTSVQEQVILGNEDWLFYDSTKDDFMGICADEERIAYGAANLALMEEYVHGLGAEFTFVIAPNKNSLYPQYMPDYLPQGNTSNAVLLTEQLDALDVAIQICLPLSPNKPRCCTSEPTPTGTAGVRHWLPMPFWKRCIFPPHILPRTSRRMKLTKATCMRSCNPPERKRKATILPQRGTVSDKTRNPAAAMPSKSKQAVIPPRAVWFAGVTASASPCIPIWLTASARPSSPVRPLTI